MRNQFPFFTTNLLRVVPTAAKVCLGPALVMLTITQAAHVWVLGFQSFIMLIFAILTCLSTGLLVARNEAVGIRRSLAISTAIRNGAVALLIIGTNFSGGVSAGIVIRLNLLSLVVAFLYGKFAQYFEAESAF